MRPIPLMMALLFVLVSCSPQEPAWDPSRSDLLFASNRSGNNDIYLLRAGDSVWTQLTQDASPENWPVWSPDGKKIAYQKWVDGKIDIWVMNADGSGQTRLTDHRDHDYLPSWTPDGRSITFASWREEEGDTVRANHIYIMNADGTDERRFIEQSPGTSTSPEWSPDGSHFVMNWRTSETRTEVCLFDKAGTMIRHLTTGDTVMYGSPVFSPDGNRVMYYADNGSTSSLVVQDIATGETATITVGAQDYYGRWSADGTWIVFTTAVEGSDQKDLDIVAVPADGSGVRTVLVTGPGRESEASWRVRSLK